MAQPADLAGTGARIEALLGASAAGGPVALERAEELVRLVVELYGAGLERVLEIIDEAGVLNDDVLTALADDDLVAGLLLVHGLHPYDVEQRVEQALIKVRPYLGSHGGDVELLGVSDEGVVTLRMLGSCDGCASSSVTLKLAVEGAIEAAAPEVVRIDVAAAPRSAGSAGGTLISVDSLTARLRPAADAFATDGGTWLPLPDSHAIAAGAAVGRSVGGLDVVVCTVGDAMYVYRDACGSCGAPIAGAAIERRLGSGPRTALLTCRACRSHFLVQQAGQGVDGTTGHLDPLPLLVRDGVVEVAVPTTVSA